MTNLKISQLTDASAVNAADELAITQSGVTKRATAAELKTYVFSSGGVPIEVTYAGLPVSTGPAGTPAAGQTYLYFSEGAANEEPYGAMLIKDENGSVFNVLVDSTYTWFNQVIHAVGAGDFTLSVAHPSIAVFYRDNATPGHIVLPAYDDDRTHEYRIYNIADAGVATEGPLDIYETPSGGGTPTYLATIQVNEVVRCYVPQESLGWVVTRDTLSVEYGGTIYIGDRIKFSGTGITGVTNTGGELDIAIASTPSSASEVPFTPAGDIAATDVQAAIEELDDEKQPLDADLTQIAGLSPVNDDILQRKSAVWVNRTMAQLAADLTTLAPLASPAFTGNPTAPTPSVSDNDTSIATTAFVMTQRGDIASGATLPASPFTNQFFMHTPTGRRVLMVYTGSAWYPLYSFGTMTVYVDGTNGTDSADKGTGTGTAAYKTLSYMWTQIPAIFFGNITVNVSADTYTETLNAQGKVAGGNYSISLVGSTTTIDSGTMTSAVAANGATLPSVTDTGKSWTVDEHKGRFLVVGSNVRPIISNTADTITAIGGIGASPSGAYSIIEPDTIFSGGGTTRHITVYPYQAISFRYVKFTDFSSLGISTQSYCNATFTNCSFFYAANTLHQGFGNITFSGCAMVADSGGTAINLLQATASVSFCFFWQRTGTKTGTGLSINSATVIGMNAGGSYFDNFSTAVSVTNSRVVMGPSASNSYIFIYNNTIGIQSSNGGQVTGTSTNQYSGNTTNENAVAASYGYID